MQHEGKLVKAQKTIRERLKETKERLGEFFTSHEARREQKKQDDKAILKTNEAKHKEIVAKYKEFREARNEKIAEFQETQYAKDIEHQQRIQEQYSAQLQVWLEDCASALKELESFRVRCAEGKQRSINYMIDKRAHHQQLNEERQTRIADIRHKVLYSGAQDAETMKVAERILSRLIRGNQRYLKLIKERQQESIEWNMQHWDSIPHNRASFEADFKRKIQSVQDTWTEKKKHLDKREGEVRDWREYHHEVEVLKRETQ
jgi:hypothetical protein